VSLVCLLLGLAACRANNSATPAGLAIITGAISTNYPGLVVTLGAGTSGAGLHFAVQTLPESYPALSFLAELPGPWLQAITYDDTNALSASTTVQEAATGGVLWVQTFPSALDAGTFSLALTDAGPSQSTDAGLDWPSPQGVLSLTLVPTSDVTDAGISVSVTF